MANRKSLKANMSAGIGKGLDSIVRNSADDHKPTTLNKKLTLAETGEMRATFIVEIELNNKIKQIAHWDRVLIKDVVNDALRVAVKSYEKKNGEILPIP
jgi:hypothetical protein